jgi:hypothetical protein
LLLDCFPFTLLQLLKLALFDKGHYEVNWCRAELKYFDRLTLLALSAPSCSTLER